MRTRWSHVVLALSVCSCSGLRTERERGLEGLLLGIDTNATLEDVESKLGLGNPVDVLSPSFPDPFWWFLYDIDGRLVELGVSEDDRITGGPHPERRSDFLWCGVWKIRTAKSAPHRFDRDRHRRASRLMPSQARLPPRGVPARYWTYLAELDPSSEVSVGKIERDLRLPRPTSFNIGAGIWPMMWLHYDLDGFFVAVGAMRTSETLSEDPIEDKAWRSTLVFSGYWRAYGGS